MEPQAFVDILELEKVSLVGVLLAFVVYFCYRVEKCSKQYAELLNDVIGKNTAAFCSLENSLKELSENLKTYRSDSSAEHTRLLEKFSEIRLDIASKRGVARSVK